MNDDTYTCKRCGDGVGYVSTDDLCDGCVAEDSRPLAERIEGVLAQDWPVTDTEVGWKMDGIGEAMAEAVMNAPLQLRAPEIGRLLDSIRTEIEDEDGRWNGSDVVALLCEWFPAVGYSIDGAGE